MQEDITIESLRHCNLLEDNSELLNLIPLLRQAVRMIITLVCDEQATAELYLEEQVPTSDRETDPERGWEILHLKLK